MGGGVGLAKVVAWSSPTIYSYSNTHAGRTPAMYNETIAFVLKPFNKSDLDIK